jgi:murein L,D-transpeptidase YcbB/YkuD
MHSVRFSMRFGFLAGTALVLILTAPTTTPAAPQTSQLFGAPQPSPRDYSTPGSMPKPSSVIDPMDNGIRFRGPLPTSDVPPPRHETATPLAPASNEWRAEPPAKPAPATRTDTPAVTKTVTSPARAEAAPEPAINAAPAPEPAPRPVAAPAPVVAPAVVVAPERVARPAAAPAPEPTPRAVATPAPVVTPAPERVTRPAAAPARPIAAEVAAAPNGASEADVGNKLREIITSKQLERTVSRKQDREAIISLYQKGRSFQPLWVSQGAPSARARDVLEYLRTIDADGLDPKDYPMPKLNVGSAEAQAEAELKFTETLLTYARHAMNGRVHFSRVSPNIEYKLAFDADDVLKKIAASNDLSATLETFNPPQPAYQALKAKLAEFRNDTADDTGPARIENGPVLRYTRDNRGKETVMADARVPQLRERLGLPAEPNSNYNAALAMAVGKFQKASNIQATGLLNAQTIQALNPPNRAKRLDAILASMERWRWMPRDLGKTHVVLNIPDYNLRVYNNGGQVWQTRTVVGKTGHETPLLTETMKYITVNPTWNVPQSIIYNELLPIYETTDRQIFERQGLKMERDRDGSIRVFQPPGERNALGHIRFNFPNKFLVYQHDTPERHYFAQEKRAYSHGCMRVQDPMKYAEVLLSYAAPKTNYTADSIKRMIGGKETQIDFATQIPVHITYQTAFVDNSSKLQFRDDVYGLDAKLMSILKGTERQVADVAIERPADPNFKPTPEQGQKLRSAAGGGGSPFALFEQLFR